MITIKDIAWAAGFLEGEGCFGKSSSSRSISVNAEQKDLESLLKMQKLFGGTIGTYHREIENRTREIENRTINNWFIYGRNAAQVMMTIYPLMSQRRKMKIREAMLFWKTTSLIGGVKRGHIPWNKGKKGYRIGTHYKRRSP